MSLPDVYSYTCHRTYLKAVLEIARQESGERYSLRHLARQAGFRSPANLSMVLRGRRRLSINVAKRIADALNLIGRRRKYFFLLAQISSAREEGARFEFQDELLKLRAMASAKALDLAEYRLFSRWYYTAIFLLAGFSDFRSNPEWLARRLRFGVLASETAKALEDLRSLGLLVHKKGRLEPVHLNVLKTTEDIKNLAFQRFQKEMLHLANRSFEVALSDREITCLTLGVPTHKLPQFKERIRQFREEMDRFAETLGSPNQIYQLNVQFFPLSRGGKTSK